MADEPNKDNQTAGEIEASLKGRGGSATSLDHKLGELNPSDFPLQADKNLLMEWRKRVEKLHVMQDFIRHPAVADFVQIGLQRIQQIDKMLKNRDLLINPARDMERVALAVERDMHESYLGFFDINPEHELNQIESSIDESKKPS